MNIVENSKDECFLCGRKWSHWIVYNVARDFEYGGFLFEDLQKIELRNHCPKCRKLLDNYEKAKKKYLELRNEIEYISFVRT